MAKATRPVAAKATKPAAKKSTPKKPTTAKILSTRAIDPQMKAGFKRNDNGNRPIFLYLTGPGITNVSSVASVSFVSSGTEEAYETKEMKSFGDYIRLRVQKKTGPKGVKSLPAATPTTGQFVVVVNVNNAPQEKACLDAILYDE